MANYNSSQPAKDSYDPRWFIWTILFLLVAGVSLVSYIMLSDAGSVDASGGAVVHKTSRPKN